jgi:hypothetical protein
MSAIGGQSGHSKRPNLSAFANSGNHADIQPFPLYDAERTTLMRTGQNLMWLLFPLLRFVKGIAYNDATRGERSARNFGSMRALLLVVGLLALATTLDASLYGGHYTQAFSQMVSDMAVHFR